MPQLIKASLGDRLALTDERTGDVVLIEIDGLRKREARLAIDAPKHVTIHIERLEDRCTEDAQALADELAARESADAIDGKVEVTAAATQERDAVEPAVDQEGREIKPGFVVVDMRPETFRRLKKQRNLIVTHIQRGKFIPLVCTRELDGSAETIVLRADQCLVWNKEGQPPL